MSARRVWIVVAATVAVVTGVASTTPLMLRRVDAFGVRRVAVVGAHYLAAEDAVAASGITRSDNVFDDAAPWLAALRRHPLVATARVERELPGTIVLHVTESVPVALVAAPDLRPVDAHGRVLPIAPALAPDLPVIGGSHAIAGSRIAERQTRSLVAALARLQREEPELAGRISEAELVAGGAMRLVLRNPLHAEALVPLDGAGDTARRLQLALSDLRARGELPLVRRVDARYTDQVVVTLN